ncbi:MAG: hypothetical protein VBE63_23580 [Lamprobacter sp.]|uniref:hypothetical protein n=1 Tax=Lamprobacter sp. TaxID=3100796 RepID=UPI002B25D867|nr:hypothetical protein [Lamprobacter sp.]MEA3642898.1 hypothetical protein [Lamprobacter sp.]
MELGPIPNHLKRAMREHFLSELKGRHSLETYELDLFWWFRRETEETWLQMDVEEQKYIQEQIAAGAEEINDSGIVTVDYYRKRMRFSHIIFLTSLLESGMKRECNRLTIALHEKILFKASDLKGDPWSARKVFLERYGSFQTPNDLWDPIKKLLAVRNALVHHNGEVSMLTKDQAAALGKIPGIDVKRSEIDIDVSYVDQASESVRKIMKFLHDKTNSVVDRAVKPQIVT